MKPFCTLLLVLVSSISSYSQVDSTHFKRLSDSLSRYLHQDTEKAAAIIKQMDAATVSAPKSPYRVKYLNNLGILNRMRRDIASAIRLHKEAIEKADSLSETELVVRSMLNLAVAYGDAGQLDESTQMMRKLEGEINETGEDYGLLQTLYANLTTSYSMLDEMESAYKYNNLLKSNMKSRKDSLMYYLTRFGLLEIDKKYPETVQLGKEALLKVKKIDKNYLHQYYFYIAQAYLKLNDYANGYKYLSEAKEMAESLEIESSSYYSILADYYKETQNYRKAIPLYDKLKSIAKQDGSLVMHIEALNGLATSYEKTGDYKKGLTIKNELFVLTDSLNGIERRKAILDLDAKYELKDKERAIELQKEKVRTEARNKNIFAVLLGVCMLFLGFAIYLIRRVLKDKKEIAAQRNQIVAYATRLEESNKMRDKLFAMISHDLRSPISSLSSNLALYNDEKPSKRLQDTLISLSNIRLILNNLLKWASLKIKNDEPFLEEVNIGVLLDSVVSQVQSQTTGKDITILSNYNHRSTITTDEHYMQIVFRNLISNAVKFTPHEGFIRITTSETDNSVLVEIRDSGMGMAEEKLATLFSYPISSKGTSGETGSGLGLTLCKELLDKVGGTIEVKSKPSVGTQFTVGLPVYFEN